MAAIDPRLTSYVGAFLSTYDQTALEGVEQLCNACSSSVAADVDGVHALLEDGSAVDAFMSMFARPKCDKAPVMRATRMLLELARKPARALLLRLLCGATPRKVVRESMRKLSDHVLPATIAALDLVACMIGFNAKQTTAKFGRKVPLDASAFADSLPYAQLPVRPARVRLMLSFLRARHPDVATAAIAQHGFLTRLCDDAVELAKRIDSNGCGPLVNDCVAAIGEHFVASPAFTTGEKRALLTGQRSVVKGVAALLALPPFAAGAAAVLRRIVNEVAEPSRDYAVLKDAEDSRMPNGILFQLLRHLRPKHRTLDAHLVVYVLHRAPDLYRPYLGRVATKLPELESNISVPRASVSVCNVLTRLFLCPVPEYIASHSARIMPSTSKQALFYDLTPTAAADEVLPTWFAEAAHRHLGASAGSSIMVVFLLQCMQAAVSRAAALKHALQRTLAVQQEQNEDNDDLGRLALTTGAASGSNGQIDADSYFGQFELAVQERLPRREVLQPVFAKFLQQASESEAGTVAGPASAGDTKAQFVLQRIYLYLRSAAALFHWRTPWSSLLPANVQPWSRSDVGPVCVRSMNSTTIRSICMLVLNNLRQEVKLPKLVHIQSSGAAQQQQQSGGKGKGKGKKGDKKADAKESADAPADAQGTQANPAGAPLLLELLLWAITARDSASEADNVGALRAIANVLVATVHSLVRGAPVSVQEAALWLRYLTDETAVALVFALNWVAQLLPRQQQAMVEQAAESGEESGFVAIAASAFAERQSAAAAASPEKATAKSEWQLHITEVLSAFEALIAKVTKRWPKRAKAAFELLQIEPDDSGADGVVPVVKRATEESDVTTKSAAAGTAVHSQLLRKAVADLGTVADQHTRVVQFFPPPQDNAGAVNQAACTLPEAARELAPELPQALVTEAATPHASRTSALIRAIDDTVAMLGSSDSQPATKLAYWYLAAATHGRTRGPSVDGSFEHGALAILRASAAALAELRGASFDGAVLSAVGCALASLTAARWLVLHGNRGADFDREAVAEPLVAAYQGTLGALDRTIFAALALLDRTPERSPRSSSNSSGAGSGDDAGSDDADTPEPVSEVASDEEDEHPVVRDSGILGRLSPPAAKRTPRSENDRDAPGAGKASKTETSTARRSPDALESLRRARFLVGGASCLASATPEVEALTSLVEGMTDRDIVAASMGIPLRVVTPLPEEGAWDPLRLIFPDSSDRRRGPKERWYAQLPGPSGAVAPYPSDTVSSSLPDVRIVLPLLTAVSSLRYKHACPVAASTVVRLAPYAVRCLSALDGSIRRMALRCLALMYRSLHPIPRLIVNAVRLHLQKSSEDQAAVRRSSDAAPRLLAVHSAHFTLAFHPAGHSGHPLHEAVTESLSLPDERWVPLEAMLTGYPATAVVGTPTFDRPTDLVTTPQLRHVLQQLAGSCVTWQDYAFLSRRSIVQQLCVNVSFFRHDSTLRQLVLAAIKGVCLNQVGEVSVHAAVRDHVVPWILDSLLDLANPDLAVSIDVVGCELLELLRAIYPYFRTANIHHRRTVSVALDTVRFARAHKVVSRTMLHEALLVVALAWRMGGASARCLETADERASVREMMATLDACGATVAGLAGGNHAAGRLVDRLRAHCGQPTN